MKNVFHFNTNIPYNLRSRSELYSRNPKTVKYGTETISYLAPKIWSLVPNAIKSSKSLDVFKSKIIQYNGNSIALVGYVRITCNMSVSSSFSNNYFFKNTPSIMCLIRFEPMLLSCFCIFRFLTTYVDISGINCRMN